MKISLMRGTSHIYKLTFAALLAMAAGSCKKAENDIVKTNPILKPYSMFAVDTLGNMDRSNDGDHWMSVKNNGGNAGRAVVISGNNVIWVMKDQFAAVSLGNENQFNPIKHYGPNPLAFNQSMILDIPEFKTSAGHNRVYMAGNDGFGVIYSDTNGKAGSWFKDMGSDGTPGSILATSLAKTTNSVFAYDYVSNTLIKKPGQNALWTKVITSSLPTGGVFFLASFNNTIVLGDSSGSKGIWYSNDEGVSWAQYTGLPTGAKITCMRSAFGQVLLVGTVQYGMFSLANGTEFKQVNNGLASDLIVRNIAPKSDIYKNEQIKQYVYIATNKGVFRSVDLGNNWINVFPEKNMVLIY